MMGLLRKQRDGPLSGPQYGSLDRCRLSCLAPTSMISDDGRIRTSIAKASISRLAEGSVLTHQQGEGGTPALDLEIGLGHGLIAPPQPYVSPSDNPADPREGQIRRVEMAPRRVCVSTRVCGEVHEDQGPHIQPRKRGDLPHKPEPKTDVTIRPDDRQQVVSSSHGEGVLKTPLHARR